MPLSGGVGMKLMQKMGWQPGQVLGRRGEGYAEPIAVQVKIDRKGLSSNLEKMAPKKTSVLDVQGNLETAPKFTFYIICVDTAYYCREILLAD